jgi:hypothetical protein
MAKQSIKAIPKPSRAQNELLGARLHVTEIARHPARQTIITGTCTANIERRISS